LAAFLPPYKAITQAFTSASGSSLKNFIASPSSLFSPGARGKTRTVIEKEKISDSEATESEEEGEEEKGEEDVEGVRRRLNFDRKEAGEDKKEKEKEIEQPDRVAERDLKREESEAM
jgi:hypothetical protein